MKTITESRPALSHCHLDAVEEGEQASPVYSHERWYQLLKNACAKHGVNKVAGMLGYNNHTGTSQMLVGKYAGKPDKFAARVMKVFNLVDCPHTSTRFSQEECGQLASARAPLNNPMKMQHWRACQQCPKKQEV